MDERTYEYLNQYLYLLKPIFSNRTSFNDLINEVYYHLIHDYQNVTDVSIFLGKHSGEIIDIFVTQKVKPEYSEDFRYAYINVNNKIKNTYLKTGQFNKDDHQIELLSFYVIFVAILNNCDLKDFSTFKMDGFIEQYATIDIIKQKSVAKQQKELSEENKRIKCEKRAKLTEESVKALIAASIMIGTILTGNLIINLTKGIINYIDEKNSNKKITDMETIDKIQNGNYNYENNEFIRS